MRLHPCGKAGVVLLVLLGLCAAAAPGLAPYDPEGLVASPFARPSLAHPLGANDIGQDLLSQLLYGARTSLAVGLAAALLATAAGVTCGLFAGVAGGAADFVVMRAVDVLLALPYLPLMIVLSVFFGARAEVQVVIMAAVMWPRTARVLRAQALATATRGHVLTARVMGAGPGHLLGRHVLPSMFPLIVPELVRTAGSAITMEASLAFLGLGDPVHKSWGSILFYANARSAFLTDAWLWWVVPPGAGIGLTVLALGLIGFGLEERARPRLRFAAGRRTILRVSATAGLEPASAAGSSRRNPAVPARITRDRPPPLLTVEDLRVTYVDTDTKTKRIPSGGAGPALDGVNLVVRAGETVALVGESGGGKTTLVISALALESATPRVVSGRIICGGVDVLASNAEMLGGLRGRDVALIPQNSMNALNPVHRAVDQVAEAIQAHASKTAKQSRRRRRARAVGLLESVGLPSDRCTAFPHELSGGMRQRVAIAIALANSPRLLIADEPTSGLDVVLQAELVELLRRLRRRLGMAMLLVSHDVGFCMALADRLIVMQRGRVLDSGETTDALASLTRCPGDGAPAPVAGEEARSPAPFLHADHVSVAFRRPRRAPVEAVRDVSFSIGEREWVGLIGPSGAGKTTIAKVIVGLTRPAAGRVCVAGGAVARGSRPRTSTPTCHLVLQDPYDALPPAMRVADIVAEPLEIRRVPRPRRSVLVERGLEAAGLSPAGNYAARYQHELSGGERQRVALARALVLPPRLLVADEPTSLLDASRRLELLRLMRRLTATRGVACLYITHDVGLAVEVCDRLIVMDSGSVVEVGPPGRLLSNPQHPTTVALLRAAAVAGRH